MRDRITTTAATTRQATGQPAITATVTQQIYDRQYEQQQQGISRAEQNNGKSISKVE